MQQVPYIWTFKLQTCKDVNMCSINVRHEWNCSLPCISYCWQSFSSTISHVLSLLQSVTPLAFYANPYMPAIVPYCTFQGTVRFNFFFIVCVAFNVLFVWKVLQTYYESESHSVVADSLQPHGLYSPWNSPGQNTGVSSCFLLQGIFPNQGLNPGLKHCRQIRYHLSHQESPNLL